MASKEKEREASRKTREKNIGRGRAEFLVAILSLKQEEKHTE